MHKAVLFIFVAFTFQAHSQTHTISGRVTDSAGKEPMINATIVDQVSQQGTSSNEYGFYSLTLPEGRVSLRYSYVGYEKQIHSFHLASDTTLNIVLKPGRQIDAVTITRERTQRRLSSPHTSLVRLQPEAIEKMPVLLGEPDLIKILQMLPGVQRGHEGFSGMHVRGGNNDQNLILLDGMPVYNVNHLFGMFSVFNPATIKHVKLYKGAFPARYQGRVSSVVDVRMKEGNMKEFRSEGSIGIVSSKLSLEGPIKKDTSSFIISGRRTYIDILARPFIKKSLGGGVAGYYFYDLSGKVNYRFSEKSRLYLSSYLGKDRFYKKEDDEYRSDGALHEIKSKDRFQWGNVTGLLRWNYRFSDRLFANTSLSYSNFRFLTGQERKEMVNDSTQSYNYSYRSGLKNYTASMDFDYMLDPDHYVRFGIETSRHLFNPGISVGAKASYLPVEVDTTYGNERIPGIKYLAYLEDDWKINPKIRANVGLNFNLYRVKSEIYLNLEPRMSARYMLSDKASVKASWGLMNQYLHLLTHTSIGLPTDLWVPATEDVPPVHSDQYTLAGVYQLNKHTSITLEGFYKEMSGLIEYKEGASFLNEETGWQEKVTTGEGRSYGAELFVEKTGGKTTGWISYTLSWAKRQFDALNFGKTFPFKYDRRHAFNISVNHRFTDKLSINATWVYNTGRRGTLQVQDFFSWDMFDRHWLISYYPEKNNLRFPDHHRLDIGVNMKNQKEWGERIRRIGLYNAYSRINPFYLTSNRSQNLVKVGIFPIMPFVSYKFKF